MEDILNNITNPKDLKKLNYEDKKELAEEIRSYIIDVVSKNGGHLASNLGVVELTIALHSIFDTPKDKIIWDVGHQTYVHKILTGRKNQMKTLRRLDGISGFPKTTESEYDCFNTGHSSTSISAALGMARARDILNENYKVIAVIGDGALTGGMAEEALNDAGASKSNIIVVLNDNLLKTTDSKITLDQAFSIADNVLEQGITSITDLLTSIGEVNVDFADIKTTVSYKGHAYMGIGRASGEKKVEEAVKQAIDNPLTQSKIDGAKGVIFNVKGDESLSLIEINSAIGLINDKISEEANVIFGTVIDNNMNGEVAVTVIATGVE